MHFVTSKKNIYCNDFTYVILCYLKSRHDFVGGSMRRVDVYWEPSNKTLNIIMDLTHDDLFNMHLILTKRNRTQYFFSRFNNLYVSLKKIHRMEENIIYILRQCCKIVSNDNYCCQHQHGYYQRFIYFTNKKHFFDIGKCISQYIRLKKCINK